MRTRYEIIEDRGTGDNCSTWRAVEGMDLVLEVLLDIRDLLANPPAEISGTGSTFSAYGGVVVPCSERTKGSMLK